MEIKVNEFVRTKNGTIRKIAETLNNIVIADKPYYESYCETEAISKRDIVKHSNNIIDLIEERRLCEWIPCKEYYRHRYRKTNIM